MVENKKTKRERDIKAKLMAAIAMLLVSSIMMVSTTYAWFTLSTAPEVTGITTAVGANGNLEMALLPAVANRVGTDIVYFSTVADALAAITTGSADSMSVQDKQAANITWGNLVDLTPQSKADGSLLTYGMENIVLYPSALNLSPGSTQLTAGSLLNIPEYGSDGRVAQLVGIGSNGTYVGDGFYESTGFGVRAVGKASGMTARELAYRNAKASADSAANRAASAAASSLNIGGNALASIAMKHSLNEGQSFTDAEIQPISDTYAALLATDGAIGYLETAMKQYIIAAVLATADDDTYEDTLTTLTNADLAALKTAATEAGLTALTTAIEELNTLKTKVEGAKSTVDSLIEGSDAHTWEQIRPSLTILGDPDNMELNGHPIKYYTENNMEKAGELAEAMQGSGLKLVVKSGIYVDMANFCGKISASVKMEGLEYNGIKLNVTPTMIAEPTGTPHMDLIKIAVNGIEFEGGATGATKLPISDFYGYIIDMAFRTNAADSYLQLQTEAEDRIYQGNTANAETMGAGSTMSFSYTTGTGVNPDTVKAMMAGIRVVFFDPNDMTVKQFARLDVTNVSQDNGVVNGTGDTTTYTLTAKLYLCDAAGNFLTDVDTTAQNESKALIPLGQNTATALSVLVYLDGETIGNESVSTANITGKMNLQFSSSADLTPMEYSDLREGSGETPVETQTPATTESDESQG